MYVLIFDHSAKMKAKGVGFTYGLKWPSPGFRKEAVISHVLAGYLRLSHVGLESVRNPPKLCGRLGEPSTGGAVTSEVWVAGVQSEVVPSIRAVICSRSVRPGCR